MEQDKQRFSRLLLNTVVIALVCLGCGGPGATTDTPPPPPTPDTTQPDSTPPEPDTTQPPASFAVSKVSPDIGRTAGGELVIIEGTLFETGTEVFFGSS